MGLTGRGTGDHDPPTVGGDRYELVADLDDDGPSRMRRAHDRLLERDVTVSLHGPQGDDAWRSEIRALSLLDHPHVAHLYDGGLLDGGAYTVLHSAGSSSLADRVARAPVSAEEATTWCLGLADGLAHMHARGVAHGSTGPHAVLFDETDRPQWVGFAAATVAEVSPAARLDDLRGLARVAVRCVHGRAESDDDLVAALDDGDADDVLRVLEGYRYTAHRRRRSRLVAAAVTLLVIATLTGVVAGRSLAAPRPTALVGPTASAPALPSAPAPSWVPPAVSAPPVSVPPVPSAPPVPSTGVAASRPDGVADDAAPSMQPTPVMASSSSSDGTRNTGGWDGDGSSGDGGRHGGWNGDGWNGGWNGGDSTGGDDHGDRHDHGDDSGSSSEHASDDRGHDGGSSGHG